MSSTVRLIGTTAADGSLTLIHDYGIARGLLYAVEWVDGDLADGVDAVLSMIQESGVEKTLLTLTDANDDASYYPRADTHDATGAANGGLTYPLINGRLKLVVSSGGNAKTGGCKVHYFL